MPLSSMPLIYTLGRKTTDIKPEWPCSKCHCQWVLKVCGRAGDSMFYNPRSRVLQSKLLPQRRRFPTLVQVNINLHSHTKLLYSQPDIRGHEAPHQQQQETIIYHGILLDVLPKFIKFINYIVTNCHSLYSDVNFNPRFCHRHRDSIYLRRDTDFKSF